MFGEIAVRTVFIRFNHLAWVVSWTNLSTTINSNFLIHPVSLTFNERAKKKISVVVLLIMILVRVLFTAANHLFLEVCHGNDVHFCLYRRFIEKSFLSLFIKREINIFKSRNYHPSGQGIDKSAVQLGYFIHESGIELATYRTRSSYICFGSLECCSTLRVILYRNLESNPLLFCLLDKLVF